VTGEKTYTTHSMAKADYEMPEKDIAECIMVAEELEKKNSVSLWDKKNV